LRRLIRIYSSYFTERGDVLNPCFPSDLMDFIKKHYLKNRTIVSSDIPSILDGIEAAIGLPLIRHSYSTGDEIGTWIIPDRWDVREAWLKSPSGELIASYASHPLFLAPYSQPFSGKISLTELKKHLRWHKTQSDAFYYEHRLAYDHNLRLKDWRLTLPKSVIDLLEDGIYEVCIDVDIGPGSMLIGEVVLKGETEDSIALLSDYCHPGQVNDSFSGLVVMMDVMRQLAALPSRKYTYRFYIFPETIGSIVHLHSNPSLIRKTKLAIFSEFVGWGKDWLVTASDKLESTLAQDLADEAAIHWPKILRHNIFGGIGNDELVFDYAGIPSLSVQMTDIDEYHSSNDEPGRLLEVNLRMASDIVLRMCSIVEEDEVFLRTQDVPVHLTRFNLYKDATLEQAEFKATREILYAINGRRSILELALETSVPFEFARDFLDGLKRNGLIIGNRKNTL
jgi:aminopeptidase-like protein